MKKVKIINTKVWNKKLDHKNMDIISMNYGEHFAEDMHCSFSFKVRNGVKYFEVLEIFDNHEKIVDRTSNYSDKILTVFFEMADTKTIEKFLHSMERLNLIGDEPKEETKES